MIIKKTISIIFITIVQLYFSQNITCEYELKFKPSIFRDSLVTDTFILDVFDNESLFRSGYEKKSDSALSRGLGIGRRATFFTNLYSRKKGLATEKVMITSMMRNKFSIKINEPLQWEIKNDKLKIGDLDCQKAETYYGGRHWTAWFSTSVNMQEGPYIFKGLPGLIIKICDDNFEYDFNLIQIKKLDPEKLYLPNVQAKEISWTEFQKIIQNFYDDPFYEIKSAGVKYKTGDENGNVINVNPQKIINANKKNIQNNDSNLIEKDKMIELK